jgi:protease-4
MMEKDNQPAAGGKDNGRWERDVINKLAFAAVNEQRKTRRWNLVFKFLFLAYLVTILILYGRDVVDATTEEEHTALVELKGVIAADEDANAESIITGLQNAFENKNSKAVILRINSPGGSPVQAGYINDEIERLREKYPDKPIYAVVTDMCASGGYYVAVAAEKIYVDKASIVGSIGVRMGGFGFVDAMDKVGVERRLLTAGEHKGFLDPFQPAREDDIQHVKTLLNDIHQQFISTVREGRGERLHETPALFSGLIWTGEEALDLGLVDGLASTGTVARDVIGAETIVDYTPEPDLLEKFSKRIGVALAHGIVSVLGVDGLKLK